MFEQIEDAYERVKTAAHRTPIMASRTLNQLVAADGRV
jgi:threonine dehydratase